MASFITLANELQLIILQHTLPYDFESLALTCKHLYAVSAPLLPKHNSLRRRYRHFRFGDVHHATRADGQTEVPRDAESIRTVPELLQNIAADPVIAHYIIHADLGDREFTEIIAEWDVHMRPLGQEVEVARLRELIRGSEHLAMVGADPDVWFDRIMADRNWASDIEELVDYPIAFLLSLLLNVESLTLPVDWRTASVMLPDSYDGDLDEDQKGVAALTCLLVTRANDVAGIEGDQPLRRLRTLHPTKNVDSQSGMELDPIAPFLALDSLREVYHESITCGRIALPKNEELVFDFQAQGLYPVLGPNLETLVLRDAVMDAECCSVFFRDMHKLRVFKMEYSMKDEVGWGWDSESVVYNLSNAVGKHLEVLSLTAMILGGSINPLFAERSLLSNDGFRSFEALTYLELDTRFFIREENDPPMDEDENEGKDHTFPTSLMDIAPPTLKTFVLHVPAAEEQCAAMKILLCDLDERRSELPGLESVRVVVHQCGGDWYQKLEDWEKYAGVVESFCKDLGIDVSVAE